MQGSAGEISVDAVGNGANCDIAPVLDFDLVLGGVATISRLPKCQRKPRPNMVESSW